MDEKLKKFYSSSQHYLSRLERHGEGSFAKLIELCKAVIPPEASILECGCGLGLAAQLLAKQGFKVTGIDASSLFISKAKKKYGDQHNLTFLEGDVGDMPYSDNVFDAVVSCLFMEHVTDVKGVLAEMCRVVKEQGILIIIMPNFLDPIQHLTAGIWWKDRDKYKPWEARSRPAAFYEFIRTACVRIGKAYGINRKIYPLTPILSEEEDSVGLDFDATWLANCFDVKHVLKQYGFSIECLFPEDPGGKIVQIMRKLGSPKGLQTAYTEMRASGFVIIGKKK